MKKYNLLKVLGISVFVAWLLTLVIPGSQADYTGNIVAGNISAVGIWSLLSNFSISISYFNGIAVFLIAVAVFYAIVNKLDVYNKFVSKVTSIFNGKESLLVIISILVFGILGLFVSDPLILIAFIPFVYQVMKGLEIDKKTILASTIIAALIGAMCGIYSATLFSYFGLKINTLLVVKVIVFVLSVALLIFFVAPRKESKVKETVKEVKKEVKKATTKAAAKKSNVKKAVAKVKEKKVNKALYAVLTILFGTIGINKFYAGKVKEGILSIVFCWTLVPTILSIAEFIAVLTEKADKDGQISASSDRRSNVIFGTSLVMFVLFVTGTIIPWESLFTKVTIFSDFNTWLGKISIGDYAVFSNLVGAPVSVDATTGSSTGVINAFGSWAMLDVAIFMLILSAVIALCNKIKFNDFVSTATAGIKKILPVAITAMLISIILVIMVTTGVNVTICNWIVSWAKGFNVVTTTLSTIIGGTLVADFYYFVSTMSPVFLGAVTDNNLYGVLAFLIQSIFYLTMVIAPTSVGLIIGLYYLDIPYGKWFKYIWKVLLGILVIIIVTALIVFALV